MNKKQSQSSNSRDHTLKSQAVYSQKEYFVTFIFNFKTDSVLKINEILS